ncbi:MAG: hypothetical protein IKB08_01315 [Clostridia bacterium]|nr:hypothetical protein [Clostridia bacterium]
MKKYISVFYLTARESIYKIFVLWLASALVQTAAMWLTLNFNDSFLKVAFFTSKAFIPVIFSITLILTALLLSKTGMQFNSKTGYTLRRLRIKERKVFYIQTLYNFMMLFCLLVSEVLLIFVLIKGFKGMHPEEGLSVQTEFKAFYKDLFIQNLFAGRDILRIVRNIITVLSLSLNLSAFSFLIRRNSKWIGALLVTALSVMVFVSAPSIRMIDADIIFMIPLVMFIIFALIAVCVKEEQYDS